MATQGLRVYGIEIGATGTGRQEMIQNILWRHALKIVRMNLIVCLFQFVVSDWIFCPGTNLEKPRDGMGFGYSKHYVCNRKWFFL
jgi:hypothetical protein